MGTDIRKHHQGEHKKALALRTFWRVYPIYTVPKSRKKRLEEIRNKQEIYEFIDSASAEKIRKLHEEIKHLKENEEGKNP